ncbi:MAG: PD-(D/E)XK nuclease family protein [Oligoflexales bacterium]
MNEDPRISERTAGHPEPIGHPERTAGHPERTSGHPERTVYYPEANVRHPERSEGSLPGNKIFPPETCLVTALAKVLAAFPRQDMRATVVMPTQRMAVQLINLLTDRVGSFLGLNICNLDNFIRQRAGQVRQGIADPDQEKLILRILLASQNWRHLRPGCESELQVFFSEIWLYDLQNDGIDELRKIVQQDIYKSDLVKVFLEKKFEELAAIRNMFFSALRNLNLYSNAQGACLLAAAMCERNTESDDSTQQTFIVGFNSVVQPFKKVFSALSRDPNVEIWLHDGSGVPNAKNPLVELRTLLDPTRTRYVEPNKKGSRGRETLVVAAPNPYAECRRAVELAKEYMNEGWAPSQIGFLLSNEQAYAPVLRILLAQENIEANFAVPFCFRDTGLGTILCQINKLLGGSENCGELISFLENEWVGRYIRRSGAIPEETTALGEVSFHVVKTQIFAGWTDIKAKLERMGCLTSAALVDKAIELFAGKGKRQRFETYVRRLLAILETIIPVTPYQMREERELLQASLEQVLPDFGKPGAAATTELTSLECSKIFADFVLNQPTHSKGDMLAGVQVLSIPESRHIPFPIVMVLGCHEGDFPQGLPDDSIVEDFLKRRLGLPGWSALEAMEDVTFHLLLARTHKLHLFYSQPDSANKRVRSRFIQVLEAKGGTKTLPTARDIDHHAKRASEQAEPEGQVTPLFGFETSQSATKIDRLLRCPYQYLLTHQKVNAWELADERMTVKEEGTLLHGIMEAFFTGKWEERAVLPPWPDMVGFDEFGAVALARLEQATETLIKNDGQTKAHLRFFAWPKFVSHLQKLYGEGSWNCLKKGWREYSFQQPIGDVVSTDKLSGELRGTIDSVDFVNGFTVITDFKRKGVPDSKELRQGLCSQLLLYAAIVARRSGDERSEGSPYDKFLLGYYSLIDGEWTPVAAGAEAMQYFSASGLVKKNTPLLSDLMEALVKNIDWRLKDIEKSGRYYADPSQCGLCQYGNVCRKDDPNVREQIATQNVLEKRMQSEAL